MKKGKVSNAVIRRLPRYYGQLDSLYQVGVVRISSSALGKAMNLTASQIRQDLSCFGEFGQQGYGYNVESLRNEIAEILGMNLGHTAIILGAGNLGRALIHNFQFSQNGFRLTAAFDTVPSIVGRSIAGVPVYSIDMLDQYLAELVFDQHQLLALEGLLQQFFDEGGLARPQETGNNVNCGHACLPLLS